MTAPDQTADGNNVLELRLLGSIEVYRGGERQSLPRSKKTRALLAYLAITGRPHRRARLCDLLWDFTDDPRGGLRWSLSRLRRGIPWDADRVESAAGEVSLRVDGMRIDALELSACARGGVSDADTETLERLAALPRGPFLEGLELPDLLNFDAWCTAQRERLRAEHCQVLAELVTRLRETPERALEYANQRAAIDALDGAAHADLLELLVAAGRFDEAERRRDAAMRLFRDLGASGAEDIERTWRALYARRAEAIASAATAPALATPAPTPTPAPAPALDLETSRTPATWPFVGRAAELAAFAAELDAAAAEPRLLLVTGEPGAGKSRLAERWMARAQSAGRAVLYGRAFEVESRRPFGPWVDALQTEIDELLSEDSRSREALFSAAIERLASMATDAGLVLVLDDLQWLDRDSIELVHVVARHYNRGPLVIALFARAGELNDNEAALRAVRSLSRMGQLRSIELAPLGRGDIESLVAEYPAVDAAEIFQASAGNPLYAIELARAGRARGDAPPSSLSRLVRERVEQLPEHAIDVLRWGAVLGHALSVDRLEKLCSLDLAQLIDALEHLDRHALLRTDATRATERYVFAHDVVREAVYAELSGPRRRLMHKKVVELLAPRSGGAAVANEVAHHAALAGEALLGVEACLEAGRQSLRVFANGDAEALARRGLRLAEELDERERVTATLELLHLQYSARTPDRDQAAERCRELAERALDLGLTHAARLGFQMLSFLRWESASLAAAHTNIMQAERVSRSAEPAERCAALAQAAKCLVLLEKNLNQAEAFVMEAGGLSARGVGPSGAVAFATGMIAAYRGEGDAAIAALREARDLSRQAGDRLTEFAAIEQWVMLQLDRGEVADALALGAELADLGARVRPGAEEPSGRALWALAQLISGDAGAEPRLRAAIGDLRAVDAKYQLSFLLTRWAAWLGDGEPARAIARDALEVSRAIGRSSEQAIALAVLGESAADLADRELSWVARARLAE